MVATRHFKLLLFSLLSACGLGLAACETGHGVQSEPIPSPSTPPSTATPEPTPTPSGGTVQPIITF